MSRLPGLDLMRAIAIIWVLFFHAQILGLGTPSLAFTQLGWMGVDLFFVLSGFLIGSQWLGSCEKDASPSFLSFYLRRAFRILPAYLVVVAVYFGLPSLRETKEIQPLWQFLTFTENLLIDFYHPKAFSHVWSLCVEEHFYLLFPLISLLILKRKSFSFTLSVCAAVVMAGMAWRGYVWLDGLLPIKEVEEGVGNIFQRYYERIYYPTWCRLDGLLMGIMLALCKIYRPAWWRAAMEKPYHLLGLGGVLLGGAIVLFQDRMATAPNVIGYPMLSMALALIVASAASTHGLLGRVRIPGIATIATLSYSIYLSHKLVYRYIRVNFHQLVDENGLATFFLTAGMTLLVGAGLYWLVERPFLRLRDRLLAPHKTETDATNLAAQPAS